MSTIALRYRSTLTVVVACVASLVLSVAQLRADEILGDSQTTSEYQVAFDSPGTLTLEVAGTQVVLPKVVLPNLPPGSLYQLAFVTAGTHDATSGDSGTYNTFVKQQAALSGSLPVNVWWSAIMSTSGTNAIDNVPTFPSIPIYNTHGERVASGSAEFWSGTIEHSIQYDQNGVALASNQVWTGTSATGLGVTLPAQSRLGEASPMTGFYPSTGANWIDDAQAGQNSTYYPLYALSSPITVPAPEPSTLALLGIGAVSLLAYAWRRLKRTA